MPENMKPQSISKENLKNKINEILSYSNNIMLNGGEPTLNSNLIPILRYINKVNPHVQIGLISNVRMLSNKIFVDKLFDLGLKNFKIITSIYGYDAKTHDSITRTPDSFVQQINGINNIINKKIKIELRVIVNKLNYQFLDKISHFLLSNFDKNDFLNIVFVNMKIQGKAHSNWKTVSYKVTDVIPQITKAVLLLEEANFNVLLFHFPHCVLPKFLWKNTKGITSEENEIVFMDGCEKCLKRQECCGIWKGYARLYGDSEFKNVFKVTDMYISKIYYDKDVFLNVKQRYDILKDNEVAVFPSFFVNSNNLGAKGIIFQEFYNHIPLADFYHFKKFLGFDKIFKFVLSELKKINSISYEKLRINPELNPNLPSETLSYFIDEKIIPKDILEFDKSELVSCHGDLNLNNILISSDMLSAKNIDTSAIFLIDFDDMVLSNNLYDMARFIFHSPDEKVVDLFIESLDCDLISEKNYLIIFSYQLNFLDNLSIKLNKINKDKILELFKHKKYILKRYFSSD